MHVKWHNTCLCYTKQNKLGWEREFKEFGQNLRKFGSSKKEFRFQAVEALYQTYNYYYSSLQERLTTLTSNILVSRTTCVRAACDKQANEYYLLLSCRRLIITRPDIFFRALLLSIKMDNQIPLCTYIYNPSMSWAPMSVPSWNVFFSPSRMLFLLLCSALWRTRMETHWRHEENYILFMLTIMTVKREEKKGLIFWIPQFSQSCPHQLLSYHCVLKKKQYFASIQPCKMHGYSVHRSRMFIPQRLYKDSQRLSHRCEV